MPTDTSKAERAFFSCEDLKFQANSDDQYRGGCSVPWGMFSTAEDVQYRGGYFKINVGDILSPVGDIMIHRGEIINTGGGGCSVPHIFHVQYHRRYHDTCVGGCSVHPHLS